MHILVISVYDIVTDNSFIAELTKKYRLLEHLLCELINITVVILHHNAMFVNIFLEGRIAS